MPLPLLSLILVTVTLSAIAQYALKLGADRLEAGGGFTSGPIATGIAMAATPAIWLGLCIYGLSAALWIWVLSRTDLSVAYPFVGLSFILTMAIGFSLLGEEMSVQRIVGTLLIAAGCVLVARTG